MEGGVKCPALLIWDFAKVRFIIKMLTCGMMTHTIRLFIFHTPQHAFHQFSALESDRNAFSAKVQGILDEFIQGNNQGGLQSNEHCALLYAQHNFSLLLIPSHFPCLPTLDYCSTILHYCGG